MGRYTGRNDKMTITITIKGDEERAIEIMSEIAEDVDEKYLPVNVYPGNKFQIHECPEDVREIVRCIAIIPGAAGTAPDTSLFLGVERLAWLKEHGGIQPTIRAMIDKAMSRAQ